MMQVQGSTVSVACSRSKARLLRLQLVASLYKRLFQWLLLQVNQALRQGFAEVFEDVDMKGTKTHTMRIVEAVGYALATWGRCAVLATANATVVPQVHSRWCQQ